MMLTNDEMRPNRYARWHQARTKVSKIRQHLEAGGIVQIVTMTRATNYSPKHADWFEARKSGAYVRSGKQWLCFDGNLVRFGHLQRKQS